jgi:hypothetical protein
MMWIIMQVLNISCQKVYKCGVQLLSLGFFPSDRNHVVVVKTYIIRVEQAVS